MSAHGHPLGGEKGGGKRTRWIKNKKPEKEKMRQKKKVMSRYISDQMAIPSFITQQGHRSPKHCIPIVHGDMVLPDIRLPIQDSLKTFLLLEAMDTILSTLHV